MNWASLGRAGFFLSMAAFFAFEPAARGGTQGGLPAPSPSPSLLEKIQPAPKDRVLTLSAEYTGEVLANLSGGLKTGATYEGLLRLGLKMNLQKVGWPGASVYASVLDPHGEGISREYSGDFNLASNIDAYNSFRLFELWFEQKLLGDTLSVRIGQMAADQEFFVSINSALFLNSGFGTMPTVSFNNKLPVYPIGGLGIRVEYKPDSHWFFRAAVFDADAGDPSRDDKHGLAFRLNPAAGVILLVEAGGSINSASDDQGLAGTYKIGSWFNSREDQGPGIGRHNDDFGCYGFADQMIYRKAKGASGPESLSVFLRVSAAPQERKNLVPFYLDAGLNLCAPLPSREKDVLGLGIGYTKLSDYFNSVPLPSGHETVLEATYKLQLNDRFFLQPDLQCIINPGGARHLGSALVATLRFDLTY